MVSDMEVHNCSCYSNVSQSCKRFYRGIDKSYVDMECFSRSVKLQATGIKGFEFFIDCFRSTGADKYFATS